MAKSGTGDPSPIGGGDQPAPEPTTAPVNEEVLWKARAQEAEEEADALRARVQELETELAGAHQAIQTTERRGEIDRELTAARAVDLETARLLTEATIGEMDQPDVAAAVRDLCARKPFLFATPGPARRQGNALSPDSRAGHQTVDFDGLADFAQRARTTGDRAELLRYLRVRRGR